jgi:hypothetical protein
MHRSASISALRAEGRSARPQQPPAGPDEHPNYEETHQGVEPVAIAVPVVREAAPALPVCAAAFDASSANSRRVLPSASLPRTINTSVKMIEKHYSRHITHHTDAITRAAARHAG